MLNNNSLLQTTITHNLKNLNNSKMTAINYSHMINSLCNLINTPKLRVDVEDDIIDSNILHITDVDNFLNDSIIQLQQINPNNSSKKKTKKAKKAIQRLRKTLNNVNSSHINWFIYPASKHPKPITKSATRFFLEELQEMLGATLLPDEQIAVKQQEAIKNNN